MRAISAFVATTCLLLPGRSAAEPFPDSSEVLLARLQETEPAVGRAGRLAPGAVQSRPLHLDKPITAAQLEIILDVIFFELPAQKTIDPARLPDLILQLGAEEFAVRRASAADLATIGEAAIPALEEARRDPDPERRHLAAAVLKRIRLMTRNLERLQKPSASSLTETFTPLLDSIPRNLLPALADGILARAQRGSDHNLHALLTQIVARHFRKKHPALIARLAPLLDGDDPALAAAVIRSIRPRHAGDSIHPLHVKVLQHPNDAVAFQGLGPDLGLTHSNDPLLEELLVAAKSVLARNPPLEAGLATARVLQTHGDPAGLEYLRSVAGNAGEEQLALLDGLEMPVAIARSLEFVVRAGKFRKDDDSKVIAEAASFLLNRDDPAEIRAGIGVLELLEASEVSRVQSSLNWPRFSHRVLLAELGRAVAMDDGVGPGGNAAILLRSLRENRFDRPLKVPPPP